MAKSKFSLLLLLLTSALVADTNRQVLLNFEDSKSIRNLRTINDSVMGGRSVGRYRLTDKKMLEFYGRLSLENNGGFASIRLPSGNLNLKKGDILILRLRGDGRTYNMNLYAQQNLGGISFRQSFKTLPNKLIEVKLPIDKFIATWRGRAFPKQKLTPGDVTGLGFFLGDKKEGEFNLQLESISVQRIKTN
jgi:NADH dehydrogenase [ubiquinone] 1 alpha subcomplex assembly factor 1